MILRSFQDPLGGWQLWGLATSERRRLWWGGTCQWCDIISGGKPQKWYHTSLGTAINSVVLTIECLTIPGEAWHHFQEMISHHWCEYPPLFSLVTVLSSGRKQEVWAEDPPAIYKVLESWKAALCWFLLVFKKTYDTAFVFLLDLYVGNDLVCFCVLKLELYSLKVKDLFKILSCG